MKTFNLYKAISTLLIASLPIALLSITTLALSGCNKLVDATPPRNTLVPSAVFTDSANVKSAIIGMYASINSTNTYNWSISVLNSLYADEITSVSYADFATNSLTPSEQYVGQMWTDSYASIYNANAIIEGVTASASLSTALQQQAIGESLFIRALCHFYLVNIFGNVPLITSTDISKTATQGQATPDAVYAQIIADLKQAITYLPTAYPSGTPRTRANKAAAMALLARVYLYTKDWADAEQEAGLLIGNNAYTILTDLTKVFLSGSTEAIFQWDGSGNTYTTIASNFVPTPGVAPNYVIMPGLLNSFEQGDLRKTNWVGTSAGSAYPAKYKVATANTGITEYYTVFRLAEQYLIRSEARAHQNNIIGSQTDLNVIRSRAGLGATPATDSTGLLQALEQENRVEYFCEWSHRLFDLRRTGRADAVLSPVKPGWKSTDIYYPIPSSEIGNNPNLKQNQGYN